ncbi:hypothetical protein ACFS5J_04730 [Flavobacterium chuncheonense]|uniref:Uncharacterized protein n=1 Tax=Flavobacterium chuncheonense TaxID=2026653 RepID=A0ABW5YK44_9FLAO
MKHLITIIFVLFSIQTQAQNVTICDSLTKSPISFANVIIDEAGQYSDGNGNIYYADTIKKINITHVNYYTKQIINPKALDTIFLNPKITELKEVIVTSDRIPMKIGFLKKDKYLRNLPVTPKYELIIKITPNTANYNLKIDEIFIPLYSSHELFKKGMENNPKTGICRVNIYKEIANDELEMIYQSDIIKFLMSERDQILLDLRNETIKLDPEGLYISVEMIGSIDDYGIINTVHAHIRPGLTSETSKDYMASTYSKRAFDNKPSKLASISNIMNEYFTKIYKNYTERNFNIAIGLVVSKE